MGSRRSLQREIEELKRDLRTGGSDSLIGNIAVAYRALGNRRRALLWWRRAAQAADGDAWLEVGYCLQYGIGVRRDPIAAARAYRSAARSRSVTEYGHEEALYHLATVHLDIGARQGRSRARALLRRAQSDGDYPAASEFLAALEAEQVYVLCRCRRGLSASLGGQDQCRLHGGRAARRSNMPLQPPSGARRPARFEMHVGAARG